MVARLVIPSAPPVGRRLGIHGRGRGNERSGGGCTGHLNRAAADGPGTAPAVPSGRKPFVDGRRLRSRAPSPWTTSIPGRRGACRVRRTGCVDRGCGGAVWAGPVSPVRGELLEIVIGIAGGGCFHLGVWERGSGFVRAGGGRGRADGARWLFAWNGFRLFLRRPFPVAGWGRGGGWDFERASRGCLPCCVGGLGGFGRVGDEGGDGFARFPFPLVGGGLGCYGRLSGGGRSRLGVWERGSGFCPRGRRAGESGWGAVVVCVEWVPSFPASAVSCCGLGQGRGMGL